MKLRIMYFAKLRDLASTSDETVVYGGQTVSDLMETLMKTHPGLLNAGKIMFAVNEQFVSPSAKLKDGDVVALLPPLNGG